MKLPGYLRLSRHHVYCFRRRIPDDLRDRFVANELRCSLKTKDRKQAVRLARICALKIDLLFEYLRSMGKKKKPDDALLQTDMVVSFDLGELGRLAIDYDPSKASEKEEADRRVEQFQKVAAQISAKGQTIPPPVREALTLGAIIESFFAPVEIKRRSDKPATVRKDRDALKLFQDLAGDHCPMTEITQMHAVKFSTLLDERALAANTKNNHMGAVSKFSRWVCGRRPDIAHTALDFRTLRFKTDKRSDEQREAFTNDEVLRILRSEVVLKSKEREPHKFWLPYIAAYSAMRVEEIAQLNPQTDIVEVEGVVVFNVNDQEGKQLKNKTSRRLVPIHPELIKAGLLQYVKKLKDQNAERLFPKTTERDGRLAKNASKAVNRLIYVNLGIKKTLHSFRHSVATQLKRKRVDEAIAAAILGHAHGGITYSRYGKDHHVKVLLEEGINHISFDDPIAPV